MIKKGGMKRKKSEECMYLELINSETTTVSCPTVVSDGGGVDEGLQLVDGAGEESGGLPQPPLLAGLLLAWLVEPELDTPVPLLVEVYVGYDIVVLHHCDWWRKELSGRAQNNDASTPTETQGSRKSKRRGKERGGYSRDDGDTCTPTGPERGSAGGCLPLRKN